jgi:hypothetical protein
MDTRTLKKCDLTFANPIRHFGPSLFEHTQIEEITIPDAVTLIGARAFREVKSLQKVNFSPNSRLYKLGTRAFAGTSILELILPASLVQFEPFVFEDCANLRVLGFAAGSRVERLDSGHFRGTKVTKLILPIMQNYGPRMLSGLPSLTEVELVLHAEGRLDVPRDLFEGLNVSVRYSESVPVQLRERMRAADYSFD